MTIDSLKKYVDCGREIEFLFHEKRYSITYGTIDGKEIISFCEFYKYTSEVETVDELLLQSRDGYSVKEMWCSIDEESVWIS